MRHSEDHFTLITAAAAQWHDFEILSRSLTQGLSLIDITTEYGTLIVTGPKSRDLFHSLNTEADLETNWLTHLKAKINDIECSLIKNLTQMLHSPLD